MEQTLTPGELQEQCLMAISAADHAVEACSASVGEDPGQISFALLSITNSINRLERLLGDAAAMDEALPDNEHVQKAVISQTELLLDQEIKTLSGLREALESASAAASQAEKLDDINRFLAFSGKLNRQSHT